MRQFLFWSIITALVAGIGINKASAAETAPTLSIQAARQLVAEAYQRSAGQGLIPVRIALRPAAARVPLTAADFSTEGGATTSQPMSPTSDLKQIIEVTAELPSKEVVVIDRFLGGEVDQIPLIVDATGSSVGYFRIQQQQNTSEVIADGSFHTYFLADRGLFPVTGNLNCEKPSKAGMPKIEFRNATWRSDMQTIEFDIRSNCRIIEAHGGKSSVRSLNLSIFPYEFASDNKELDHNESGRVSFAFGVDTSIESIDLFSSKALTYPEYKKCRGEAVESTVFRVCGPAGEDSEYHTAFWRVGTFELEYDFSCSQENLQSVDKGEHYFIHACGWTWKVDKEDRRVMRIEFASRELARGVSLDLECTECESLWASRLALDFGKKLLSFNLDTDAKEIFFEGKRFLLPDVLTQVGGGQVSMPVPVLTFRFNDQWQVTELSASPLGAVSIESETSTDRSGTDEAAVDLPEVEPEPK